MITIPKNMILRIIYTLKQLDVRGFESMDALVGCVNILESVVKQAEAQAAKQEKAETEEK